MEGGRGRNREREREFAGLFLCVHISVTESQDKTAWCVWYKKREVELQTDKEKTEG